MEIFKAGSGRTEIIAEVGFMGNDVIVHIYGGDRPHIGAVAVGVPRPSLGNPEKTSASVSVFTLTGHKDDHLAREAADFLAAFWGKVVVAVAGFHVDAASEEEINIVLRNCRWAIEQISKHFSKI